MRIPKRIFFFCAGIFCLLFAFSEPMKAQERSVTIKEHRESITYTSRMELPDGAEPPKILGLPTFKYPASARKNNVEGKLEVSLTLAKDGTVQNVAAGENLSHGVTQAITDELKRLRFEPAKKNGEPVDAKMFFNFIVSTVYGEKDKIVTRLKIIENPDAVYPENQKAAGLSGKVSVSVLFSADGNLQILGVSSEMPKEFRQAAAEAARKIRFEPAVNKATNQKVSQKMTLTYDFKP